MTLPPTNPSGRPDSGPTGRTATDAAVGARGGSTPPTRGNGPGLAALILGVVAVVIAVIPVANVLVFVLGTVGIIVGIVGLVRVDRPRRQALWGVVLSTVSLVIAGIMIAATFASFFAGDDGATPPPPAVTETAAPREQITEVLPVGTPTELVDAAGVPAFEATVTVSTLDANTEVLGNARNVEAPAGMQWALARITATPLSPAHTDVAADLLVEYLSPDGHAFTADDEYVVAPEPQFSSLTAVSVGEAATGFVVMAIPVDDPASGFWMLSVADGGEPAYFAVE